MPTQVGGETDWTAVACGDYHTEAIKTDATMWGWGFDASGELGIGTSDTDPHPTPAKVGNAST